MIGAAALAAMLVAGPAPVSIDTMSQAGRGPAVVFEQSGGITGWVSRLTISPNGEATVVDHSGARHKYALTPNEQHRVTRRLAAADLPEIAGRYATAGAADLFVYRIASGGSQVVADHLALPQQAQPLVRTLTRLTSPARWGSVSTSS